MFRILPGETATAAMHMALDEACMEAVARGESLPTFRLYRWRPSAVTIGNFQCLTDEVDVEACRRDGVPVVRRQTGGGAVYHDAEGEITYSIIAPEDLFPKDIIASYEEILACIIDGLSRVGIQTTFRPINDLVVAGKKIGGNAQTRRGGVLLQHGTILYRVDPAQMFTYLTPDKSKVSDKPFIKSVLSAVTSVSDHVAAPRSAVEEALREAFITRYPGTPGVWSITERDRATELAVEKYGHESWNAMR